jgi:Uma2 family endonuclease
MASKTLITPEQYLATPYEWEPEYVHGEIVERSMPTRRHAIIQQLLSVIFSGKGCCLPGLRVRLASDVFRVPDFAFYLEDPKVEVPASPPLLVVEIGSPDDRISDVIRKMEEYRGWRVAHIWFIEPELKQLYVYEGGLRQADKLELSQVGVTITVDMLLS